MPLTGAQREGAWPRLTNKNRAGDAPPAKFTKPEMRDALDAAVAWIEVNQASFVAALAGTAYAGNKSTVTEKRELFAAAFEAVYGVEL